MNYIEQKKKQQQNNILNKIDSGGVANAVFHVNFVA